MLLADSLEVKAYLLQKGREKLKIVGRSDIGKVRSSNQDSYDFDMLTSNACFALVCDGMGGENGGSIASNIACEFIGDKIRAGFRSKLEENSIKNLMVSTIEAANTRVYKTAQQDTLLEGMGTTVVLAIYTNNILHIAHAGDSRLYIIRDGMAQQITVDHSVTQALVEQGKINQEEARTHPNRNYITRAVGVESKIDIEYTNAMVDEGSKILLCSDGLTNFCSDEKIAEIISEYDTDTACSKLIEYANLAGGYDNITAVIIC